MRDKKMGRPDVRQKKWGDETQDKKKMEDKNKLRDETRDQKKWGDKMQK